jgi:hypothetical protein
MQNNVYQQYIETCERVLYEKDSQREQSEALIIKFLKDPSNFPYIEHIFEKQNSAQLKLITIESLGKSVLGNPTAGPTESISSARYGYLPSEDDIPLDTFEYNKTLLKYFIFHLKQTSTANPNFIINSVCDFFGNSVKYLIFNDVPVHVLIVNLKEQFFGANPSLEDLYIGFKLFYFCMTDIIINSHHHSYFKYKKVIFTFQNVFMFEILNTTRNVIKYIVNNLHKVSQDLSELIILGLEVYYKCLIFPFNLTYYDFTTDVNLEEITMTIFPEDFAESIGDMDFHDTMFRIISCKENQEMMLYALRILARVTSTRISILPDEIQSVFKRKILQGFTILVNNCPSDKVVFGTEIVEYILRTLMIFGGNYIKNNSDLQPNFESSAENLSQSVIMLAQNLDDPLFVKLIEFWDKLESAINDDDGRKKVAFIQKCMNSYCSFYVLQSRNTSFYTENVKTHKKFRKLVNNRFDNFKQFFVSVSNNSGQFIELFERLNLMEAEVLQGTFDPNLYITRLGHFILIVTKAFLKSETSYYGYQSYIDSLEEQHNIKSQNHNKLVSRLCYGVLNVLQRTSVIAHMLRPEILRGFEMSVLLFFETFTLNALEKYEFDQKSQTILVIDDIFKLVISDLQLMGGFNGYFDILTSKLLGNLEYKDTVLSKFSIVVLRTVIEKIKKIYKGKSEGNILLETFAEKLFSINNSSLSEPKFYKLRSDLFETIALSYLDDNYDDYIQNSHLIFNRIIKTNSFHDGSVDLMKTFFDVLGIYRAITLSKIVVAFTKISYPRIQNLLESYGSTLLSNPEFIATLLDFYTILIENTFQKYSTSQSHTIMFKILADSCRTVSVLVKDINQTLENIKCKEEMIKFLENNLKLVKKFLKIFNALLKYSDVSFSIFHFFGDMIFLEFVKGIHHFMFLISESIITYFPDKEEDFFLCFRESCSNLSDFIIEFLDPSEIQNIFQIIFMVFAKRAELILRSSETRSVYDESLIHNVNAIIPAICTSIFEEQVINVDSQQFQVKLTQILVECLPIVKELTLKIIEFCNMANYNVHLSNMISDIIFNLICVFGSANILSFVKEKLLQHWQVLQQSEAGVNLEGIFSRLQNKMTFRQDIIEKEKFHMKFKDFIKDMVGFSLTSAISNGTSFPSI